MDVVLADLRRFVLRSLEVSAHALTSAEYKSARSRNQVDVLSVLDPRFVLFSVVLYRVLSAVLRVL